jgi:exodeoxyribonuclease VII large subunit
VDIDFKKEADNLVLISYNENVSNSIRSLVNELFLNVKDDNGTFTIQASMPNLELFYNHLNSLNYNINLTDKMKNALNNAAAPKKKASLEKSIIDRKDHQRPSTRRSRQGMGGLESGDQNQQKSVTLTRLFHDVKMAIESNIHDYIWLEAEIANLTRSPKGHMYLDLIETDANSVEVAKSKALIWATQANIIESKFQAGTGSILSAGQKVLLKVKVAFDAKFGLSLTVSDINPSFTLGDMEAKVHRIRAKLKENNIYDQNKRHQIPFIYKSIAVISPQDAAGLKDFQVDANKLESAGICSFDYYQAFFQGKDTTSSIVQAFRNIKSSNKEYDAIVVIRGGGAKTDLHQLNEYDIAECICTSDLPVIVGIGHQIDHGLLDEVSCLQQDTPSKVIGYIYSVINEKYKYMVDVKVYIDAILNQMIAAVKVDIDNTRRNNKSRLENSVTIYKNEIKTQRSQIQEKLNRIIDTTKYNIQTERAKVPTTMNSMIESSKRIIKTHRDDIQINISNQINTVKDDVNQKYYYVSQFNPKSLFEKGFNVALNNDSNPVKSVDNLNIGDDLTLYFNDGQIKTKIEEIKNDKAS